jgi:hypothetical protein
VWFGALVSSVVPFGFVLLDRRLKRDLKLERALPAV